jgi:hypothetical protein
MSIEGGQATVNALLGWLRLPGDVLFTCGGVLPLLWIGFNGVRYRGSHQDVLDDGDLLLFTEVTPATPGPPVDEQVGAR